MSNQPKKDLNDSSQRPRRPVRPHLSDDLVLTPGGMRPRELVYQLEPGQHVSTKDGRVQIIDTATGKLVKDLGESGTPGETEAGPPGTSGPVPGLPDTSWIENSQWRNGGSEPIVYFSTTWVVPPAPASSDNQLVYIFNGMQPDSAVHILQPVLQWGSGHAGGGNFWTITNWYADGQGGPAVFQPLINVNSGDVLQGIMTCTGKSGTEFNYKSSFAGFPAADVTVTDVDELTWAYETLECYGMTQCSDYPNIPFVGMTDIEIKTGTPGTGGTDAALSWFPSVSFTDCGQACVIVSNNSPGGEVDLYFRLPPWQILDNNPACIAIAADGGFPYELHNTGKIWKYVSPPLTGWQELDNNPACIAIAADGGNLYELHNTGKIWKYVGPPLTGWQELGNNPACVAIAASGGNLYQRFKDGEIWKYTGTPLTGWQQLDNNPACIAIAADGDDLYELHNTGKIWKYVGPPLTGWQELDNNPACIAIAASGGNLYELHKTGDIWKYIGPPITGWQQLDNNPACIAIAADGNNLYELHNTGQDWRYVGPPFTGWQQLNNNAGCVAIAASNGRLYERHKNGEIWKLY